jgi:hypothetical protein
MEARAYRLPRRFGPLDSFIILLALLGFCYSLAAIPAQHATTVSIFRDGHLIARYPLTVNRDIPIEGKIGKLILRIHDGSARIISADCPGKICISMGAIRKPSQELICVPNHVLITINDSQSNYDAITQ